MADVNLGAGSSTGLHPVKTAVTAQTIAPNNVKRFIKTKIWLIIDIKIVKMIKTLKLIAETKLYLQHDTVNTKNGGFLILVMIDRKNLSEDLNFRLNVARSCCDAFSSIFMYPIHILDFCDDEFLYVSDVKGFLGGYTSEELNARGWRFLLDTCVVTEREKLKKAIMFLDDFYSKQPVEKKKDFSVQFNYTIKIKDSNMDLKVNHQLVPLYIDSQGRASVFLGVQNISEAILMAMIHKLL